MLCKSYSVIYRNITTIQKFFWIVFRYILKHYSYFWITLLAKFLYIILIIIIFISIIYIVVSCCIFLVSIWKETKNVQQFCVQCIILLVCKSLWNMAKEIDCRNHVSNIFQINTSLLWFTKQIIYLSIVLY